MSRRMLISLVLVAVQAVATGPTLYACGGAFIPDCWLGRDEQLLRSPRGDFLVELRRALPAVEAQFVAQPPARGRGGCAARGHGTMKVMSGSSRRATGWPKSDRKQMWRTRRSRER